MQQNNQLSGKMGHYNRVKLQGLSLLLMLTIPSATIYWQQAELTQGLIT